MPEPVPDNDDESTRRLSVDAIDTGMNRDNTNDFSKPDRSARKDHIENDKEKPGRQATVNNDENENDVPDYANRVDVGTRRRMKNLLMIIDDPESIRRVIYMRN